MLYSYRGNLPQNRAKNLAQECKTSTSGWRASLYNILSSTKEYLNNFTEFVITNKGDGCAENGCKMEMTSYQKGDGYIQYCIKDMVRELLVNEIDITTITLHRSYKRAGYRSVFFYARENFKKLLRTALKISNWSLDFSKLGGHFQFLKDFNVTIQTGIFPGD